MWVGYTIRVMYVGYIRYNTIIGVNILFTDGVSVKTSRTQHRTGDGGDGGGRTVRLDGLNTYVHTHNSQ